jgi:hypothetical protein
MQKDAPTCKAAIVVSIASVSFRRAELRQRVSLSMLCFSEICTDYKSSRRERQSSTASGSIRQKHQRYLLLSLI